MGIHVLQRTQLYVEYVEYVVPNIVRNTRIRSAMKPKQKILCKTCYDKLYVRDNTGKLVPCPSCNTEGDSRE